MSQPLNPDDWIDFTIPEVSTDANAEAYGTPRAIPRQTTPPPSPRSAPALDPNGLPAGFAGPPMNAAPAGATPQLPATVPPGAPAQERVVTPELKREWTRIAVFVGVGAGLVAAAHYGKKLWERWFGK